MAAPVVELISRDQQLSVSNCWNRIQIVKTMNAIANSVVFESSSTEIQNKQPLNKPVKTDQQKAQPSIDEFNGPIPFRIGENYEVRLDDETISIGYLDELNLDQDSEGLNLTYTGRGRWADFADCMYGSLGSSSGWQVFNIEALTIILQEYIKSDLGYIGTGDVGQLFRIDQSVKKAANAELDDADIPIGETLLDILLEVCLRRGIIPIDLGDGLITLTKGTKDKIAVTGDISQANIISRSIKQSNINRYSIYTVYGFSASTDRVTDIPENEVAGFTQDEVIRRFRPHVEIVDRKYSPEEKANKALFEANMRAGQSRKVQYVVSGWLQNPEAKDKALRKPWQINELINVKDDFFLIDEQMLISDVEFNYDDQSGFTTTLSMVHKDTYSLEKTVSLMKTGFDLPASRQGA